MATCIVCGMKADERFSPSLVHDGTRYFFMSEIEPEDE